MTTFIRAKQFTSAALLAAAMVANASAAPDVTKAADKTTNTVESKPKATSGKSLRFTNPQDVRTSLPKETEKPHCVP